MTSAEFTYWQAYSKMHPFGPQWEDYKMGKLIAAIMNQWRRKKDGHVKPEDVFHTLKRRGRVRRQSVREQKDILKAFTQRLGGQVIEKGE